MSAGPFILEIDDVAGERVVHAITPAAVLPIGGAADLREKLDAYSDPIENGVVKNTPRARRWYVEKTLPALRHYCDKYEVEQPDWLVGNNHWETMTDEERARLFGPGELRLREFQPANCADIAVVRDDDGEGQA